MTTQKSRFWITLGVITALGAGTAACAYDPYGYHGRGDHHRGDHRGDHHGSPGDHDHDHH